MKVVSAPPNDPIDINPRRVDAVRVDFSRRDKLLGFDDRHLGRGRHDRIEITRGLAELKIAAGVGAPRLDDGEVSAQP